MNENFDIIRKDGRLLYEYIRGSHLYNLNVEGSDIDTSGVYICKPNELLGFKGYMPQVSDNKHDNTWYEIGEYIRLLMKSNPTILEALFVPKDKIIGEVNPIMQILLDNRFEFLTKECFNPFFGYAQSQIIKARGLNKKIVNPIEKHLHPLDFVYTFKNQGSTKIINWLENHGLKQKYCGLVNIPNMWNIYGVYYDWGMHAQNEENWKDNTKFIEYVKDIFDIEWERDVWSFLESRKPIGYRGIVGENDDINIENITNAPKIFDLRLSSIDNKNTKPICYISYNASGYTKHCNDYKEFKDWEKNRNPKRYESNLNKNYDSKNLMHCFRMVHMSKEIALGEGLNLERTWDRDFLLDIRNHKFEYDEIISLLEREKEEMNELMEKSTIKEHIDTDFLNDLTIEIRKKQLKI